MFGNFLTIIYLNKHSATLSHSFHSGVPTNVLIIFFLMRIHNSHKLSSLFFSFFPFLFLYFILILWIILNDLSFSSLFLFVLFESVVDALYWIIQFDHFVLQHYNFYLLNFLMLLSMEAILESNPLEKALVWVCVWVWDLGPRCWAWHLSLLGQACILHHWELTRCQTFLGVNLVIVFRG